MNAVRFLPEMLTGEKLNAAMTILPDYDEGIRNADSAVRLMALSDLYRIYIPSPMSQEIYSKLYLALLRSLQKKGTKLAVQQYNENAKRCRQHEYRGILGGADSFTIIGISGTGKSSAISRALDLMTAERVIEIETPYTKLIPCVVVQCPFDSSVKGMLLEILRKVDEALDSRYYQNAIRARATTDMLIGSVSQVALNHIGLLIVDEIQNVVSNKQGKSLIGALTQLINNSGISICMVGTPECAVFFQQAMQLARRSLGLQYGRLAYDAYFRDFCATLFRYQYVRRKTALTDGLAEWLYEHSSGIISNVVSLVYDAQEIAILNGIEQLNLETLNLAYKQRLSLLHGYIEPEVKSKKASSVKKKKLVTVPESPGVEDERCSIATLVSMAKAHDMDIVETLKAHMTIVEVPL